MVKGKNGVIRITEQVAPRWKEMATRLHFEGHDIQRIETNSHFLAEDLDAYQLFSWSGLAGKVECLSVTHGKLLSRLLKRLY